MIEDDRAGRCDLPHFTPGKWPADVSPAGPEDAKDRFRYALPAAGFSGPAAAQAQLR
jgi:hypothetical protein